MKKTIIFILFVLLSIPAINQETDQSTDKIKNEFGDVFDRRDDDENYPDNEDVKMYKEENNLIPLTKKQKIVWAFRTAKEDPFI